MSLFGNTSAGSRSSSKHLVEFRAGKMSMKGNMVHPDKRKGLVYVYQSDDSLIHFCWKDRTSGKLEEDLIVFPDDCEFKRVSQCTTGRVFILKFKSSSRKFFFWMQEPKTDKDEEHCKKVNDSLNNPPTPGQSSGSDLGIEQLGQGNIQDLFANMDQQQLLQLMAAGGGLGGNLGGLGSLLSGGGGRQSTRASRTQAATTTTTRTTTRPATSAATVTPTAANERASVTPAPAVVTPSPATAATPTTGADGAAAGLQLSQLQSILSQMGMEAATETEPVDLSEAITPDVMVPILVNPEVQERLKPFLPQGESLPPTAEELQATVKSAQFRQAMRTFSEALASGQLGPVMKQFGLPAAAQEAATKGDIEAFAKAMQDSESKSKDDKNEDMVVDE